MDTIIENKTREVKHKEREKKGKNNSWKLIYDKTYNLKNNWKPP
jgi:hypothetical protein